jgi:adenosine deaminase
LITPDTYTTPAEVLLEKVSRWPKVELHLHLEGSMDHETVQLLARRHGAAVSETHPGQRFGGFRAFSQRFLEHCSLLRTYEDFAFAIYRLGRNLADQNVRYAEVMWAPQIHLWKSQSPDRVMAAMNRGRRRVREEFGVEMRWIIDLVRRYPDVAAKVAAWACRRRGEGSGIVALGLGGPERLRPAKTFVEIFALARQHGLPCNPHAGEDGSAHDIRFALDHLKARRVGHGIRAADDTKLVERLAEQNIVLEMCPTSNVKLDLVESYAKHPLKQLVKAGCAVTLNTDDPGIFATTLSEEYCHAVEDCGLTPLELRTIILRGVSATYLPPEQKQELLRQFQREIPAQGL